MKVYLGKYERFSETLVDGAENSEKNFWWSKKVILTSIKSKPTKGLSESYKLFENLGKTKCNKIRSDSMLLKTDFK